MTQQPFHNWKIFFSQTFLCRSE